MNSIGLMRRCHVTKVQAAMRHMVSHGAAHDKDNKMGKFNISCRYQVFMWYGNFRLWKLLTVGTINTTENYHVSINSMLSHFPTLKQKKAQ